MQWIDGNLVLIAAVKEYIKWQGLFVLPNLESRMTVMLSPPMTYQQAWDKSATEFIRPLDERMSFCMRDKERPPIWNRCEIVKWCWHWSFDVDEAIAWAKKRDLFVGS